MAEFEKNHCTGCGTKCGRVHRPYCWRKVTMMLNIDPTQERIDRLDAEMLKHWRILRFFLCKQEHVYNYPNTAQRQRAIYKSKGD